MYQKPVETSLPDCHGVANPGEQSCSNTSVVLCNTLDGGSASVGCLGGGGSMTAASNGLQLEGGGA